MKPAPDSSDILIIGGGASGLMAGITAAGQGAQVRILERMNRIGKKILVTGNSRCNLTNLNAGPDHYYGAPKSFIGSVLRQFSVQDTLTFFQNMGLAWKADTEKRVYPVSEQASAVLDLLRLAVEHTGVDVRCSACADQLHYAGQFEVRLKNHQKFYARKVILASGGKAMKDLGSNGSGYALATSLGHRLIPVFPALVKITLSSPHLPGLKGVKTDGTLILKRASQVIASCTGEIQFTEYGISGIPALQISRHVGQILQADSPLAMEIDLLPQYTADDLTGDLFQRFHKLTYLSVEQSLLSVIKKRLIVPVLKSAELPGQKPAHQLNRSEVEKLVSVLKQWIFPVTGTKSWNEAQVTAGGIDTEAIDPHTLESKIIPGLYFSGEIMDVDGDCGGYNLHWAWVTGHIAGSSAAATVSSNG
jgi:predicted Rossmann fold flavoprotein